MIGVDQPQYCHERIANCQFKRFPDASHNVHQSHSAEFMALVEEFLNESMDFF